LIPCTNHAIKIVRLAGAQTFPEPSEEGGHDVAFDGNAFQRLPNDDSRPGALRALQVALQAELLRAGAQWEESLAILREMASHRRAFPSAAEALSWYRTAYHPEV
jgi:hypothetical protein